MGEGFPALFCLRLLLQLKKDFEGLIYAFPLGGGGGMGVLPEKILENLECRKSRLPHFLGLFFIFLFFSNQFSLFFSAIL